jgi:hypothetical protein
MLVAFHPNFDGAGILSLDRKTLLCIFFGDSISRVSLFCDLGNCICIDPAT